MAPVKILPLSRLVLEQERVRPIEEVVHVHDHLVFFQQHHAVGGRLMASRDTALDHEIQRYLMAGGAQSRYRDAAPASCQRPMQMPEEHVADVSAPGDGVDEEARLE